MEDLGTVVLNNLRKKITEQESIIARCNIQNFEEFKRLQGILQGLDLAYETVHKVVSKLDDKY